MEKHTNEVEDNQMRALSWKTRVSYGLGDTACNVVYGMIGSLLTIFYTDYVGISAAAIGVIMLISRIFDGCSDVIMGFVVNKTHSKYGQSRPWILWMMQNVITSITGTILPYYCKYILGNDTWMYSVLYMVETVTLIAATLCSPLLLKRLGKRNMSLIGCIGCLIGQFVFMVKPESFYWLLGCCIIRGICFAPLNSVIFGMLGDVVEFGQWKTHLRQESFIFAIGSVGTKLGNGITAAVLTQLLAFSGYVSKAGVTTQPQSVVNMIMNIYKVGPLIVWVTVVIILLLYRLDKKYPMIMKELEEREARGEL